MRLGGEIIAPLGAFARAALQVIALTAAFGAAFAQAQTAATLVEYEKAAFDPTACETAPAGRFWARFGDAPIAVPHDAIRTVVVRRDVLRGAPRGALARLGCPEAPLRAVALTIERRNPTIAHGFRLEDASDRPAGDVSHIARQLARLRAAPGCARRGDARLCAGVERLGGAALSVVYVFPEAADIALPSGRPFFIRCERGRRSVCEMAETAAPSLRIVAFPVFDPEGAVDVQRLADQLTAVADLVASWRAAPAAR